MIISVLRRPTCTLLVGGCTAVQHNDPYLYLPFNVASTHAWKCCIYFVLLHCADERRRSAIQFTIFTSHECRENSTSICFIWSVLRSHSLPLLLVLVYSMTLRLLFLSLIFFHVHCFVFGFILFYYRFIFDAVKCMRKSTLSADADILNVPG